MKIDKNTKEILKNLNNFHKKRIDKQTSNAKEYKVYDGELVQPVTDGKSKTMKAIEEFNFDNFFKSNSLELCVTDFIEATGGSNICI